jgi:hypothetical protein
MLPSTEHPSLGALAAFEAGIMTPFRRTEYMTEIKALKDELGYIDQIQAAKDRMGLLGQQVVLSVLFGITSFMATYIYDRTGLDLIGDQADDDDQSFSPIVNQLGSESGATTFSILQDISQQQQLSDQNVKANHQQMNQNQQQMLQVLTALLNATLTGN